MATRVRSYSKINLGLAIGRNCLIGSLLCCASLFAGAQHQVNFQDYAVPVKFHGKTAPPLHNSSNSRRFRTVIRRAVRGGPDFADHYILAVWGCGAGCIMFSIVDAVNGQVYDAPFTVSWNDEVDGGIAHVRNSRALHIVGSLNESNSADRWYVWDGKELKLQSEQPARHQ